MQLFKKLIAKQIIFAVLFPGLFMVPGLQTTIFAANSDDAECDRFEVDDDDVDEGDYVTLEWRTSNADDVYINNGVGDVSDDGDKRVRVWEDTTFKLTARNDEGMDTCSVRVRVDEDDNEVECDSFTVSDKRVDEGDYVTLKWRTSNADDVDIDNGVGDVRDDGSERVRVWEDTIFKLTARDGRDKDYCKVTVRVDEEDGYGYAGYSYTGYNYIGYRNADVNSGSVKGVSYTTTGSQAGVAVADVPYTGFEAGPILTFFFYFAIALWAAVIAYVLVLKKKNNVTTATDIETSYIPTFSETAVKETVPVTVNAPENLPVMDENIEEITTIEDNLKTLESHAHENYALFSSDALAFIAERGGSAEEQINVLDQVIEKARAKYPKEGDWLVLNKERVLSLQD